MKIDIFDKDLEDDLNVKALKNRLYDTFEIWNLIYFTVFVFAIMEDYRIKIGSISKKNYLIHNK